MEGVALLAVSVMGVLGNLLLLGRLARLPRQRSLAILPWHYPIDYDDYLPRVRCPTPATALPLRCIARLRAQGPAHQPAGVPERGGPAGAAHHASQAGRPRPHEPRQTELGTHLATLWHFPFSIIHHKIAKYCPSPVCRLGDRRVPRRAPLPDPPGEGRPRPRLLHAHPLHWRPAPAVGQLSCGESAPVSCNCDQVESNSYRCANPAVFCLAVSLLIAVSSYFEVPRSSYV